jgi:hypothetical protein
MGRVYQEGVMGWVEVVIYVLIIFNSIWLFRFSKGLIRGSQLELWDGSHFISKIKIEILGGYFGVGHKACVSFLLRFI